MYLCYMGLTSHVETIYLDIGLYKRFNMWVSQAKEKFGKN